jgi:hypothetical protein
MQRRHVENGVGTEFLDSSEIVGASYVSFGDFQRPIGAGARGLQMCMAPKPEIVEDEDLGAGVKQALHEMRADKSGPTGDQNTLQLDGTP